MLRLVSEYPLRLRYLCCYCVVFQPYLGAEKEGVLGFGKGMVKGVMGVAVKVRCFSCPVGRGAFICVRGRLNKFAANKHCVGWLIILLVA